MKKLLIKYLTNNLQLLLFIIISIYLDSCSKEIVVDIPAPEPKPVINCLFSDDTFFKVHLSQTTSIFDEPFAFGDGENIKLLINNTLADSLIWKNGFYCSSIIPKKNITYSILWEKDGKAITTDDYIPNKVNIGDVFFKDSIAMDEEGNYFSQLKIEIQDTFEERNFFELKLFTMLFPSEESDTVVARAWFLNSSDPVIEEEDILEYYPESLVFSDKLFNNENYVLTVNYQSTFHVSEIYSGKNYKLIVKLYSVSQNYYKYKKSLIIHTFNQTSDIWDGMGNPVPMFTNVQGGYGIFAGYVIDTDTLTKTKQKKR